MTEKEFIELLKIYRDYLKQEKMLMKYSKEYEGVMKEENDKALKSLRENKNQLWKIIEAEMENRRSE